MMRMTPAIRISIGLVSLTVGLLFLAQMIGIAPDRATAIVETRKTLSEALAIQLSSAARHGDFSLIAETLESLVERENDIKSAAVRDAKGALMAETGSHLANWKPDAAGRSTPTHMQIPIFQGKQRWATVEVSFAPVWLKNFTGDFKNSYLSLVLFISFAGFGGYFLLIKRTLRELDPSSVIPARVKAAFDVLTDGVLILDEKEQIVLTNAVFAEMIGKPVEALIGYKGSELGWKDFTSPHQRGKLPWMRILSGEKNLVGIRLVLMRETGSPLTLVTSAAPVLDNKGNRRGVLVTLADKTEIEQKNVELSKVVRKLRVTTDDVQAKNKELEFLANHDPLTLLLNRRSLNLKFEREFLKAQKNSNELSCVMCDIDHFKVVNDRYGHPTGDKVIKMVAALLVKNFRENDLVGRYGGEEFCIILPGIGKSVAYDISNRVRQAIKEDTSTGVQLTASFGISTLHPRIHEPGQLTNQADKALYIAKETGRNRVVCWGDTEEAHLADSASDNDQVAATDLKETVKEITPPRAVVQPGEVENTEDVENLNHRLQELEEQLGKRSQELQHFTAYDVQTGLPTRTLFHDRIAQAMSRGRRYENIVTVLSVSVDAVQRISETLGHESGEWLFKEICKRIISTLRAMDTVAKLPSSTSTPTVSRLSREEIGILLTDIEDVNEITWIVKRILKTIKNSFILDDKEVYSTMNIGIAIFPNDGETPEELEKNAAAAKRHARKHLGNNQYYYYSDAMHVESIKHLQIENQLHKAIENDEFLLHYQPKINTGTGKVVGVEALIRWDNPEAGMMLPYEFISIAEYSGLIGQIGDWVLSTACKQVRSWLENGIDHCSVAVNFSSKQFRQTNFTSRITEILKENGLTSEHLVVEVTENSMMDDITSSMKILHEIGKMGVSIALDDFGTGYSSLGYLKNFPVTHVKIDRSFVADIETNSRDAALVKSIVNMAHSMELQVTAEGVENATQVQILSGFGCDEMQGFLFSKPVPPDEITFLLQNGIESHNWLPDELATV